MIDISNVKKEFEKYISNYNPEIPRISLKIGHIIRVANNCKLLAESLNLNEEDTNLAIAIGYFHDIGRFEQVRRANTFSDKESKINHGKLGVEILFENNFIRQFIPDDQYDNIIKKAVLNHNSLKIEDGLTDKEILFCKIIRDADKLDIFYTISKEEYSMESIFWYKTWDDKEISPHILDSFYNNHQIIYKTITSNADVISIFYAYIFDLNFEKSIEIIKEHDYLDIFTERVYKQFSSPKIHEQTKNMLEACHNYINSL